MFEVMRIALLTERIIRNDSVPGIRPQPEDVLRDATLGGARAVRQSNTIGSLSVGKKANLNIVNSRRSHLVSAGRFVSVWVHNGQPSDIESLMVDGKFLMRDHKVLTMDENAFFDEAYKVSRRIWGEIKEKGSFTKSLRNPKGVPMFASPSIPSLR